MAHGRKMFHFEFEVEGDGRFPFDMLRYDAAYPAGPEDAAAMGTRRGGERRTVTLRSYSPNPQWEPTVDRWSSFGWVARPRMMLV